MNTEVVKKFVETFGPTGREDKIREVILEELKDHIDGYETDKVGNLIVWKNGNGENRKKLLFDAHMDQIALIVTYVDDRGFLRVEHVGYVSPHVLYGTRINFDGAYGVVGMEGESSKEFKENHEHLDFDKLYVDLVTPERFGIEVGDFGVYDSRPVFTDNKVISPALDDRIGCAIIAEALKSMESPYNDIYGVFSVQEENGLLGSAVEAFDIRPDFAIAIDVTDSADTPKADKRTAMKLGKGPAIKVMDSLSVANRKIVELLKKTAEDNEIPYQMEVLHMGGTNAYGLERTGGGIVTGALSIATRYIHTPSEVCDLEDCDRAVSLILALAKEDVSN